MRLASVVVTFLVLLAAPHLAGAAKPLVSPVLYVNPNNANDSLACIVTNASTNPLTVNVAIIDGTGSNTYCGGVMAIDLDPGGSQAVTCALNPNNFASYCQVTSKKNSAVRANHCLMDNTATIKVCSEAR
jgi:hypothetical protein